MGNSEWRKKTKDIIKIWNLHWRPNLLYGSGKALQLSRERRKKYMRLNALPRGVLEFLEYTESDLSMATIRREQDEAGMVRKQAHLERKRKAREERSRKKIDGLFSDDEDSSSESSSESTSVSGSDDEEMKQTGK